MNEEIILGNTVTEKVSFGGDADNADFVTAAQAALQAAADATAGVSFDGTTLTFDDTFVGTTLNFSVQAVNDDLTDSPETLTLTLSDATATHGTATAADAEDVTITITDIDQAVTFSVTVDDEGTETAGQAVGISEENLADNAATFTISMSEPLNTGNSASVVLTFPGTATDGTDYTPGIEAAIATAIAGLAPGHGISYDAGSNTLSFSSGGLTSLSFTVEAFNDTVSDGGETIKVQLASATIDNGWPL